MTHISRSKIQLDHAPVGPENPLPPLFSGWDIHQVQAPGDADEQMLEAAKYGRVDSVLPYHHQDQYGRERQLREVEVVTLENEHLRAKFLLGSGGRLWSLFNKDTQTELLHRNQMHQPAHFGLRNAWVAGGVEWNIGTIGHSVTTADPLHTVTIEGPDGEPALRFYEYERMRGVVFTIDAWLPAQANVLAVRVSITNPTEADVPMYWWSNIAVPQAADVRVLAPCERAWKFDYSGSIRSVPVPEVPDTDTIAGHDITYAARAPEAADYFFDVTASSRPWITALKGDGHGLAQVSTSKLKGRKLFVWGEGSGGQRWQEWLSGPDQPYLEIQAGLARTQLEHLPMPAGATWSWVEAYGEISTDPAIVHGDDWAAAIAHAEDAVTAMLAGLDLEAELTASVDWAPNPPNDHIETGSPWGAVHQALVGNSETIETDATPFVAGLSPAAQPWFDVLAGVQEWAGDPRQPPHAHQSDPRWLTALDGVTGWQASLHRGVLEAARGDLDRAEAALRESIAADQNPWAWRHLARLADHRGNSEEMAEAYRRSLALLEAVPYEGASTGETGGDSSGDSEEEFSGDSAGETSGAGGAGRRAVLTEALHAFNEVGAHSEVLALIETLPSGVAKLGRVRLEQARAAAGSGDLDLAERILRDLEVPDLKEGDTTLSDVWVEVRRARGDATPQIPAHLDFRMKPANDD